MAASEVRRPRPERACARARTREAHFRASCVAIRRPVTVNRVPVGRATWHRHQRRRPADIRAVAPHLRRECPTGAAGGRCRMNGVRTCVRWCCVATRPRRWRAAIHFVVPTMDDTPWLWPCGVPPGALPWPRCGACGGPAWCCRRRVLVEVWCGRSAAHRRSPTHPPPRGVRPLLWLHTLHPPHHAPAAAATLARFLPAGVSHDGSPATAGVSHRGPSPAPPSPPPSART
jgi:hypothetical protein